MRFVRVIANDGRAWINLRFVRTLIEKNGVWTVITEDGKIYFADKDELGRPAIGTEVD